MMRLFATAGVLCLLATLPRAGLSAQANHDGTRFVASAASDQWVGPRLRRAWREKAVAAVGPVARGFVEGPAGDDAVAALLACSKPVAEELAVFYASGELGKLPRPRDLLRVIAQPGNGDEVALFAMHNARELADVEEFDAYLQSPLEYALGLKPLAVGAAEARALRLNAQAAATRPWAADAFQVIAAFGGVVAMFALLAWHRRRQRGV